jgi:SAM-dependent methyltransferase
MAEPWFVEAFRSAYLEVYPHRDLEEARREARHLVELGVRGRVLDLCCGFGRHCAALRELGLEAFGLDLSRELLGRARVRTGGLEGRLLCGDARAIPLSDGCLDSVVSLFSSFGYFGEAGDRSLLHEVWRVLRPGGILVLDLMNPPHVRSTLVPRSMTERGGIAIEERRALVDENRSVQKEVLLRTREGTTTSWREDVRMYEASELVPWFAEADLDLHASHGDFAGSELSAASPRQVLIARRR